MRRWTLRILVCLILGAITTVAVAWGLAWWTPRDQLPPLQIGVEPAVRQIWSEYLPPSIDPATSVPFFIAPTRQPGLRYDAAFDRGGYHGPFRGLKLVRSGLPLASMSYHYWTDYWDGLDPLDHHDARFVLGWMYSRSLPVNDHRVLGFPLRVLWPGFVIDTLFYGAIWGGVWFGFASAKRFIRIKRGRCPRCGYDLRGHRHEGTEAQRYEGFGAGCPECGWNREESGA